MGKLRDLKKAAVEMDQIGKLLIGLALLVILILIVGFVLAGKFTDQGAAIDGAFSIFS